MPEKTRPKRASSFRKQSLDASDVLDGPETVHATSTLPGDNLHSMAIQGGAIPDPGAQGSPQLVPGAVEEPLMRPASCCHVAIWQDSDVAAADRRPSFLPFVLACNLTLRRFT
jgi:hypothetical protein